MEDLVSRARAVLGGRRVLVTGHTGFKGSWLALWLEALGCEVTGFALSAGEPSHFRAAALEKRVAHREGDVRDADAVAAAFAASRPEVVFHLAAQSLVRDSYAEPKATFDVNVGGTVNVLEAVRRSPTVRAAVIVTSDKCYENRETGRPFREDDPLGGHDPYSASKGAAELVVASYRRSFFADGRVGVASARAGNVIGGGDFARDRLVPDCARALASGRPIPVRNPDSVRPWQHVLDPLAGYLALAARLAEDPRAHADAFNFGPLDGDGNLTTRALAEQFVAAWGQGAIEIAREPAAPHEARMLRLDASRAVQTLGWRPRLRAPEAVRWTVEWYRAHAGGRCLTDEQLRRYEEPRP